MAQNELKRLPPVVLQADQNAYTALLNFKEYQPANMSASQENVARALEEMRAARQNEMKLANALAAARDAARQAEWCFHNIMLDVKAQAIAQYGVDSDEVQALGLKKKSERRKPGPRRQRSPSA